MKAFIFIVALLVLGVLAAFSFLGAQARDAVSLKLFTSTFYGGFLAVTFLCLLFATLKKQSRWSRITFWVIALLFLIFQGGCWGTASSFGNATGGGVEVAKWHNLIAIAAGVFVVWSLVIFVMAIKNK